MLRSAFIFLRNVALCVAIVFAVGPSWPEFGDEYFRVSSRVETRQFDFVMWWLGAMQVKTEAEISGFNHEFTADVTNETIKEYLDILGEERRMQRELNETYSDPSVLDPEEATADLQEDIRQTRDFIETFKPIVESVIQDQVTAVLVDEGFGIQGQLIPPIRMHTSPLPSVLIVSPRDEIFREHTVILKTDVDTPERAAIEAGIYEDLNLSAYVTDIGGLAFYPTMIQETTNLPFFIDVVAHEWSHIWFDARPLGLNYGLDGNVRTINESAASIIGEEISQKVLEQFYPELLPDEPPEPTAVADALPEPVPEPTPEPNVPPPFDFRAEMGKTRIRVDELLGDGKIEEAEAYMDERREVFVANGYNLRVLNQAYFAFHGAYAQDGGGAAGSNPIGPLVSEIREASPSLRAFMQTIGQVSGYEELLEVAVELGLDVPDESESN